MNPQNSSTAMTVRELPTDFVWVLTNEEPSEEEEPGHRCCGVFRLPETALQYLRNEIIGPDRFEAYTVRPLNTNTSEVAWEVWRENILYWSVVKHEVWHG